MKDGSLDHSFLIISGYLKGVRALAVPMGFISHVSTVPMMRCLLMVSFKGATMHVAVALSLHGVISRGSHMCLLERDFKLQSHGIFFAGAILKGST